MKSVPLIFLLFSIVANGPEFIVEEETVSITINTDSTVEIFYSFTIHTTKGPQKGIYIGIPTDSIYNYRAFQSGQPLKVVKESERLRIWFFHEVQSEDTTELTVQFTAEGLIHPHDKGRLSVEASLVWWEYQRIDILRVTFILPEGCPISDVTYSPEPQTKGMANRAFVFFERTTIDPGHISRYSVSFPEEYTTVDTPTKSDIPAQFLLYEEVQKNMGYIFLIALAGVVFILAKKIQERDSIPV
jgi:hypothetical protein